MKKKLLTLVFTLTFVLLLTVTASASMQLKSLTSTVDGNEFKFEIAEDGVSISGTIEREDIMFLAVTTNKNYIVDITPEIKFITKVDFPNIQSGKVNLGVFLGTDLDSSFTGVFFGEDIVLEKKDGEWFISLDKSVFDNNAQWMSGYIHSDAYLDKNQPDAVKMVTATVVDKLKTDYEKADAIHRWIANNIYYDKDFAIRTKTKTALTPIEVLTDRVSVCEGYANLAVAMLNSAGIPAVKVEGYALGIDSASDWSEVMENEANHAWVEAYVDGRWLIMDPTWDSKNMSYRGEKETVVPVAYRYFDITPESLASNHRITYRPNLFGKAGVSEWAEKEVMSAFELGLIVEPLYSTMKDNITREEFCDLVVNLVTQKLGKTIDVVMKERGVEIDYGFFKDAVDFNILAANALGIVNGKENNMFDAKGYITRQEAAVMLQRTAKVLGVETPNSDKITFADEKTFPSWSADAIAFVSASMSKTGTRVMGGVEDNKFAPTGYYTKEQSVLTVYRLFNTY